MILSVSTICGVLTTLQITRRVRRGRVWWVVFIVHLHMKVEMAEDTKSSNGLRNFLGRARLSVEFAANLGG